MKQHYEVVERIKKAEGRVYYILDKKRDKIAEREVNNKDKGRPRTYNFPDDFYIKEPLVYMATNKVNGRIYVGSTTVSLAERIMKHRKDSRYLNLNTYFIKAIRKHGWDNFEWSIIQFWEDEGTLRDIEDLCMIVCKSWQRDKGYNHHFNNIKVQKSRMLSDQSVRYIRNNYKPHDKKFSGVALAKEFGVSDKTIRNIVNRTAYADVEDIKEWKY